MTLEQMMAWNGSISLPEYEELLSKIESAKRSLRKTCEKIVDEEDSLAVLSDERGSERWLRHEKRYRSVLATKSKQIANLKALEESLALATTPNPTGTG